MKTLSESSQKVRGAQMLLKADEAGPAWTDERMAEVFDSRTRTVEKLLERFVPTGYSKRSTASGVTGQRRQKVVLIRQQNPWRLNDCI